MNPQTTLCELLKTLTTDHPDDTDKIRIIRVIREIGGQNFSPASHRTHLAERSVEAPASTNGANLKLQGQFLALTPVASSGWFGDVFISSNIISRPCTGNVPAKHAKYTKTNPWRGCYTSGLQAQQELTEETEGRVSLRYLCCLLFKSPGAARPRRTTS